MTMSDQWWRQVGRSARGDQLQASLVPTLPQPQLASPFVVGQLESIVWADILDRALIPMTRGEAMSVPAIAKARHVVCPVIASTPLRAFKFTRDEATGDETDERIADPTWATRTDDGVSPWHRMCWTVDDMLFTGWSLWARRNGDRGQLLAASRVAPDRWKFNDDGQVEVRLPGETVFKPVAAKDVILLPGPHEGILTYGTTAIRHARQLLAAAATAGMTPSAHMELHQVDGDDMTDDEIDALIDRWAVARRGDNGGVAYTNKSIELKEHGAIDAQLLIDGRNAAAVDCARLVGVSAAMVDATVPKASLTYETTQGRGLEHTQYGIEPYAEAIAARLSMDDVVPRGQRVRFDISDDLGPAPSPTGPTIED